MDFNNMLVSVWLAGSLKVLECSGRTNHTDAKKRFR